MKLALENFTWTRDVKEFDIKDDYIKIVSLPFTDLWQECSYTENPDYFISRVESEIIKYRSFYYANKKIYT